MGGQSSQNIFVLIVIGIVTIVCFLGIYGDLYEGIQNKYAKYLVNLLVSCVVGFILGAIIAVLGLAIWSLVSWIIQNILMISIILLSIFLLYPY